MSYILWNGPVPCQQMHYKRINQIKTWKWTPEKDLNIAFGEILVFGMHKWGDGQPSNCESSTFLISAVAELITVTPAYISLYVSVSQWFLTCARQLLDNS